MQVNLKQKRIAITINGVRTEYDSIKYASKVTGIPYVTLCSWTAKGKQPRSNNIQIEVLGYNFNGATV